MEYRSVDKASPGTFGERRPSTNELATEDDPPWVEEDIPILNPATARWDLGISGADFVKLKVGFESQDMDDHWDLTVEEDAEEIGKVTATLSRSWTGIKHSILVVKPSGDGASIETITWAQNQGEVRISEKQAKIEVALVYRSLVDVDFDTLPQYDFRRLWDHPAARLGRD